jgi:hypothetical protein
MHSTPTRVVLAGSVLVMGSVGTVSAVHLQSAPLPFGPASGTPRALSPATPAPQTPPLAPPAAVPAPTPLAPGISSSAEPHRSPVSARDLINVAKAPRRAVTVAVHDAEDALRNTIAAALDHARADFNSDYPADSDDDGDYHTDYHTDDYATVRRVAVRGAQREFADTVSDQLQREFAGRVGERHGQVGERYGATTAAAVRGRDWRADAGPTRRVSNPFRAGRAGAFSPRGASSVGDYVGRHRAG